MQKIIETEFQKTVAKIFGDKLVFAFIFGSSATGRARRYSDIDSFICTSETNTEHVEQYLDWSFKMHEMFGRIPDFMYPAEIVTYSRLQKALESLTTVELSSDRNDSNKYDAVLWGHVLAQKWRGVVGIENIPEVWKNVFNLNSTRIIRSYLDSLDSRTGGSTSAEFLANFVDSDFFNKNNNIDDKVDPLERLNKRTVLRILRRIPFEDKPMYSNIVKSLVVKKEFMGKSIFRPDQIYDPLFRFGVVGSILKNI